MTNSFTTSDGLRLVWHELGGGENEPPIILQHGFTSSAQHEWVATGLADALQVCGRRIIALDARGHGFSDKPYDKAFYGEDRMARDVSELVSHLGLAQFELVGYSMGAVIALIAATFERRIRRLAIGGVGEGIVILGGVDTRVIDKMDLAQVLLATDLSGFAPRVLGFRQGAEFHGADLRAVAAAAMVVHDRPIDLARIAVPTLVLAGDSDDLAVAPERLAAAISGAKLVIVPGDHGAARLSAEFATALAEFLR